ncbi:MAG TPA: S-methyl-5-thioribose-1-phosphate isomerase [candidate division Zixibacteria bacterium]|nr:S-methyl-5-thioribose-1-phosphate isomerase [candidate division Zixibacteria bacterium]
MQDPVRIAAEKIRKLEVQGARNVAIAAITATETLANQTRAKTKKEFLKELLKAKETLFVSRETEPLMRNAIRLIINQVEKSPEKDIKKLSETVSRASQQFLKDLENSKERIAEMGARRIGDNSTILTHCHSSTVTYVLKKARHDGKVFEVICTETRPVFQGKITAKEMLDLDVKTTFIVDSATRFFMNQVDMVVVGADAITSEGNVINKIGTSMVALVAQEARTPFYVVSELLKFDPATMYGDYEKIEERNPDEIWKDAPKNLTVRNPAFDVTRRDFIHGIICEEGIISPHSITEVMQRKYPWVFK